MFDQQSLKKHEDYARNPLLWLIHSWNNTMNTYLWVVWSILALILFIGQASNIIDVRNFHYPNTLELSFIVLLVLPILMILYGKIFEQDELIILLNDDKNELLNLYAPFVFSGLLFSIIGVLSFIQTNESVVFSMIYLLLLLLGLLSLFNIFYDMLNDLYYSVIRNDIVKRLSENEDTKNNS